MVDGLMECFARVWAVDVQLAIMVTLLTTLEMKSLTYGRLWKGRLIGISMALYRQ